MSTTDDPPTAEAFDLLCLLVSSARGALEEGPYTASLRLIHAAERLATIIEHLLPPEDGDGRRDFVGQLADHLRMEATRSYLGSPDEYREFLDRAVRAIAGEVRRDNGL